MRSISRRFWILRTESRNADPWRKDQIGLLQCGLDGGKGGLHDGSDAIHRGNDRQRNTCGNQAVFNSRCGGFISKKVQNQITHRDAPTPQALHQTREYTHPTFTSLRMKS